MRSHFKFLLAILVTALIAVVLIGYYAKYTVASGEKRYNLTGYRWGYKIEQYCYRNTLVLTIWNSAGMSLTYKEPSTTVAQVIEDRWLANNRAIYLNLRIVSHGSIEEEWPTQIIYDFERGELYTLSDWTLWRLWYRGDSNESSPLGKHWMTENEFQQILSRLQQE